MPSASKRNLADAYSGSVSKAAKSDCSNELQMCFRVIRGSWLSVTDDVAVFWVVPDLQRSST